MLGLFAFSLSACTTLYDQYGRYPDRSPNRYPDRHPGPVYDQGPDYRSTSQYRHIRRDADRYADLLDRELRLSGRQERAIEHILRERAEDKLRRTHPRDHRQVYPFPRDQRMSRSAQNWWQNTDRQIERHLNRNQRAEYRHIARDLERYGRYEQRRGRDRDGNRGRDHRDWDDD